METWLDRRSDAYHEAVKKRTFAWDHFTGEVRGKTIAGSYKYALATKKRVLAGTTGIIMEMFEGGRRYDSEYLVQSTQGEPDDAFYERARISRFPNHTATLVEANVGGIFAVETKKEIAFEGGALGSPDEEGTAYYRLLNNIDGEGTNMSQRTLQDAVRLLVLDEIGSLYTRSEEDQPLKIQYVHPDRIVQRRYEKGILVEALIEDKLVEQASLKEEPVVRKIYTLYTLDGWEKWENQDINGKIQAVMLESGSYAFPFYTDNTKTVRRLPLTIHRLGLERYVGHQIADGNNYLYNLLSDGRWLLRVANRPRLAGDVDNDLFDKTMERSRSGYNALQGPWGFIAPSPENARASFEEYLAEVREFYITNHQRMNQSAIERSATEILYNEAAGRTAFLALFKRAIDEMDNDRFFMASQMEAPEKPDTWHKCTVERSDDFKPIDIEHIASQRAISYAALVNSLPPVTAAKMAGYDDEMIDELRLVDTSLPEDEMNVDDDGTADTE